MRIKTDQAVAVAGVVVGLVGFFAASSGMIYHLNEVALLLAPIATAIAAAASLVMTRELERRRTARNVFIVYAQADAEIAYRIAAILRDAGFRPWLDREQILPGQVWKEEVQLAIALSSAAVIILSAQAAKSKHVQEEMAFLFNYKKSANPSASPIIPVVLEGAEVPDNISDIQYLTIDEVGWEDKLVKGIEYIIKPKLGFLVGASPPRRGDTDKHV